LPGTPASLPNIPISGGPVAALPQTSSDWLWWVLIGGGAILLIAFMSGGKK
jgi:LPXTG-motif cell wall-anchored protein